MSTNHEAVAKLANMLRGLSRDFASESIDTAMDNPRERIAGWLGNDVLSLMACLDEAVRECPCLGLGDAQGACQSIVEHLTTAYTLGENADYDHLACVAYDGWFCASEAAEEIDRVYLGMRSAVSHAYGHVGVEAFSGI